MRIFTVCIPHQTLFVWSNQRR